MDNLTAECCVCYIKKRVFWGHLPNSSKIFVYTANELFGENLKLRALCEKMHGVCSLCMKGIDRCVKCRAEFERAVLDNVIVKHLTMIPEDQLDDPAAHRTFAVPLTIGDDGIPQEICLPGEAAPAAQGLPDDAVAALSQAQAPLPPPIQPSRVAGIAPDNNQPRRVDNIVQPRMGVNVAAPGDPIRNRQPAAAQPIRHPQRTPPIVLLAQFTLGVAFGAAVIGGLFVVCVALKNALPQKHREVLKVAGFVSAYYITYRIGRALSR